ncbi:MAG TPA: EF-hand domain-containing protein [Brevundimonas sp.]|nr:EF-hand domain-containing protein [Brevundimonas sp.]
MTLPAKAFAAAVAVVSLLSAPAAAQTASGPDAAQPGSMGPPHALSDIPAWADRLFGQLDADQDAAITGGELAVLSSGPAAAMGGGRLRRMIAQSDSSNDGRISRDELIAGAQRMFTRMDADGDGVLSEAELPRPPAPPRPPSIPMPEPDPMPMPDMSDGD